MKWDRRDQRQDQSGYREYGLYIDRDAIEARAADALREAGHPAPDTDDAKAMLLGQLAEDLEGMADAAHLVERIATWMALHPETSEAQREEQRQHDAKESAQ